MKSKRHHFINTIDDLDRLTLLVVARECEIEWRRLRRESRTVDPNMVTDRGIALRASAGCARRLMRIFMDRAYRMESAAPIKQRNANLQRAAFAREAAKRERAAAAIANDSTRSVGGRS